MGMLMVSATPSPFRDIVTGFSSGSLDGMLELLEKLPDVVGANRYITVHVALGAIVCPEQLSCILLKG
jgi:biotin synthase-related radical SAM superfamily protein